MSLKSKSFDRSIFLDRLFITLIEYNPSIEQRVSNIVELIDEN